MSDNLCAKCKFGEDLEECPSRGLVAALIDQVPDLQIEYAMKCPDYISKQVAKEPPITKVVPLGEVLAIVQERIELVEELTGCPDSEATHILWLLSQRFAPKEAGDEQTHI